MTTPRCPKYTLLPITAYITLQISNFENNSAGKIFSIYQDDRCSQQLQLFRDWLVAALFAALLMWTPLKEVSQSLDNWEIAKWPQSSLVTYLVHCSGAVCTCLWWVATNQCSSNQGGLHVPLAVLPSQTAPQSSMLYLLLPCGMGSPVWFLCEEISCHPSGEQGGISYQSEDG